MKARGAEIIFHRLVEYKVFIHSSLYKMDQSKQANNKFLHFCRILGCFEMAPLTQSLFLWFGQKNKTKLCCWNHNNVLESRRIFTRVSQKTHIFLHLPRRKLSQKRSQNCVSNQYRIYVRIYNIFKYFELVWYPIGATSRCHP